MPGSPLLALRLAGLRFCRTHRRAAVIAAQGFDQGNVGAQPLGLNVQQQQLLGEDRPARLLRRRSG